MLRSMSESVCGEQVCPISLITKREIRTAATVADNTGYGCRITYQPRLLYCSK